MEETNSERLTLNDMHNMYDTETYEFMREKYGATITWTGKPGEIYQGNVVMVEGWYDESAPLLYRHIIAEQLLVDYEKLDWEELTQLNILRLMRIAELWMHPLVYCTWDDLRHLAIDGWAAKEEYAPDRKKKIREVLHYIKDHWVLFFGRNPIVLEKDALFARMLKGMYMWYLITARYDMPIERVLNGEHLENEDFEEIPTYDTLSLRENLTNIAKVFGGERAATLLRTLRAEWPKMKMWETGFENEEEVAQFEQVLFNGYDDLLAEWESDKSDEVPTEKPNSPLFAVSDKMTYEMCEKELIRIINGAKNKTVACKEILRSAAVGYFLLSDKTDQEKADLINPWIPKTNKEYVFTRDDFRKARG